MLDKTQVVPGVSIAIRNDKPLKNGLGGNNFGIKFSDPTLAFVTMRLNTFDGPSFPLYPNNVVSVLHGPKRVQGLSLVKVQAATGEEGYIFWCELRANGVIVQPTASVSASTSAPSPAPSTGVAPSPKSKR